MNQGDPQRGLNTVLGLAGAIGVYAALCALGSVVVGLVLDQVFNSSRHVATLVCVLGGVPVNLIGTLWLTRRLVGQMITPDKTGPRAGEAKSQPSDDSS